MGAFKSIVATRWLRQVEDRSSARVWQRNYYERVIRDDGELVRVRQYIANNPLQWALDRENPAPQDDPAYDRAWRWLEAGEGANV